MHKRVTMGTPRILLVVGGGIAAYKACELIRLIRKGGGEVSCVLTEGGSRFITAMTLAALSENPVHTTLWDLTNEVEMGHIQLSRSADLVVVCPDQLGPALGRELRDGIRSVAYPDLSDTTRVDWVDYKQRHASVDVAAVADRLVGETPPSATLWVVYSSGYRVIENQCDSLIEQLAVRRTRSELLITPDTKYFESAALRRFDPNP